MHKKNTPYQKALSKAMYLCSKAEKCKSDIRKKLYDWNVNPAEHDAIISELEKQKFIDEERFVKYYVRDKTEFNKWGKIKIRTMLLQKSLPEKMINKTLSEIHEKKYTETLHRLLSEKSKTIKEEDKYKKKQKLMRFAMSRGFEAELVLKILGK